MRENASRADFRVTRGNAATSQQNNALKGDCPLVVLVVWLPVRLEQQVLLSCSRCPCVCVSVCVCVCVCVCVFQSSSART